jgi:hypothetical protein
VTASEQPSEAAGTRKALRRFEIIATILLAAATVATAWSSYQASRWNGEQAKAGARANALRIESAKVEDLGNTYATIDVTTFTEWINATARDEMDLADFYRARMRAEFKPAFEAWLATDPLENPDAPSTPFQMEEYVRADQVESARLEAEAEESAATAREYIQRSSNYVLCVVLFAAALFFAGTSTRVTSPVARTAVLVIGSSLFLGTLIWLLTLPVSIDV